MKPGNNIPRMQPEEDEGIYPAIVMKCLAAIKMCNDVGVTSVDSFNELSKREEDSKYVDSLTRAKTSHLALLNYDPSDKHIINIAKHLCLYCSIRDDE